MLSPQPAVTQEAGNLARGHRIRLADPKTELPNNRMNAARRLSNLRERLDNNEALKEIYYAQMVDYIEKGQVEVAPWETPQQRFTYHIRR